MKPFKPFTTAAATLVCCLFLVTAWGNAQTFFISGKTMGTFYHIALVSPANIDVEKIQTRIDRQLKTINQHLSMYQADSELSRFNAAPAHTPFAVSSDFHAVLRTAQHLHQITGGAWDGTVKPLVDLWGFGTKKRIRKLPDPDHISGLLETTGFEHIQLQPGHISKSVQHLTLDLGSIAKGYGVDRICALLRASGFNNFLVEIGGEIYASGVKDNKLAWRVGISRPEKKLALQQIYKAVSVRDMAVATSGNYRNYITIEDRTFSHIINPVTGYPVENRNASVTVIAPDCTFADGLATALMVMDAKEGLKLVNGLEQVEVMIMTTPEKTDSSTFETILSDGFRRFLPH